MENRLVAITLALLLLFTSQHLFAATTSSHSSHDAVEVFENEAPGPVDASYLESTVLPTVTLLAAEAASIGNAILNAFSSFAEQVKSIPASIVDSAKQAVNPSYEYDSIEAYLLAHSEAY